MKIPPEIIDAKFGKLSLLDGSTYFAEVPWNRDLKIQLFVHIDKKDQRQHIENAWEVFSAVRKNETNLLQQGVASTGADECMDEFLSNEWMERSIEILPNGEGRLVYFLMMLGTFIVQFARDGVYVKAYAIPG